MSHLNEVSLVQPPETLYRISRVQLPPTWETTQTTNWRTGSTVNENVLGESRAGHDQQIMATLSP